MHHFSIVVTIKIMIVSPGSPAVPHNPVISLGLVSAVANQLIMIIVMMVIMNMMVMLLINIK